MAVITKAEFEARFLPIEIESIRELSGRDIVVAAWIEIYDSSQFLALEFPPIRKALLWFEGLGIIGGGRTLEILL